MRPPPSFYFFLKLSLPPLPGADGPQRGRGHVGRHCPYINKIWCGSVHALLRYRSKTAKMQKFPIDENFISPFFCPPSAANTQKGRKHSRNHSTPACKLGVNRPAGRREIVDRTKKTYSKTNTSPFALTSEWRVTRTTTTTP